MRVGTGALVAVMTTGLLVGGVAGCSTEEGPPEPAGQSASAQARGDAPAGPSASAPEPGADLTGEGTCTIAREKHFTCEYAMSDSRVSGTERFTAIPAPETGETGEEAAEYPTEFTLGNDSGRWVGALADGTLMTLFWCPLCRQLHGEWEVQYIGTGQYEGLVYHEHVVHPYEGPVTVTGTIEAVE